jgi:peroxiredoxin
MVLTPSMMLDLNTPAPDFSLIDTVSGQAISPSSHAKNHPMVIAFIGNHCPYVVHMIDVFADVASCYQQKGVAFIAISANDITSHPQDAPAYMKALAEEKRFAYPYCYDETQETAKAYRAACTPDLFLFDQQHLLVYRGQFDASRPGSAIAVTGGDLTKAMDCLLEGSAIDQEQTPSVGCNIKWKT